MNPELEKEDGGEFDLAAAISNIAPVDTLFLSSLSRDMPRGKARVGSHEWLAKARRGE